jgi:hypothetical protein
MWLSNLFSMRRQVMQLHCAARETDQYGSEATSQGLCESCLKYGQVDPAKGRTQNKGCRGSLCQLAVDC